MEEEFIFLLMEINTQACLNKTKYMEKDNMFIKMEINIKDFLIIINRMEKYCLLVIKINQLFFIIIMEN
jgi:hypothetical protein